MSDSDSEGRQDAVTVATVTRTLTARRRQAESRDLGPTTVDTASISTDYLAVGTPTLGEIVEATRLDEYAQQTLSDAVTSDSARNDSEWTAFHGSTSPRRSDRATCEPTTTT